MIFYQVKTIVYYVFLIIFPTALSAETVLTNIHGYTSTAWGLRQFATMVFEDEGRDCAFGREEIFDANEEELLQ